jgi:type I restriction enzyme, S subunit
MMQIELGKSVELVTKGTTPTSLGENFTESGIKFLRAQNVVDGKVLIDDDILFIDNETHNSKLKRSHILKGDVLLTIAGTIGRTAIVEIDEELNCNQAVAIIRLGNSEIHPNFLCHFFASSNAQSQFTMGKVTATIPNLSLSQIKKLKIPLPPLDQQKKIATILDTADAYRQKTKALIEKYDELTQSLFLDMFGDPVTNPKGWEEMKLGNICGVGSSKRVFVDELVEDGIPFYRGTEVGKLGEGKSIIPKLFITKEHYERLKEHRGIPKKGDLLMPSICPDGRIWVVDDDKEFYFKDGRVLWVEVDSRKINSIYLRYHMKGSFFANYNNIASGTTFAELKIVALKKMNIFYPDIALQNQFAEKVQAIESQKAQAQASLAQAEDLFNSLLQRAFKGELV